MQRMVWITALGADRGPVDRLRALARQYGLESGGHFWTREKLPWHALRDRLRESSIGLWVLLGPAAELEISRWPGLALAVLALRGERPGLPVLMVEPDEDAGPSSALPTPLEQVERMGLTDAGLGARLAARAHMPARPGAEPFRLRVYGGPGLGLWFECGPAQGETWQGAMLAVDGGEVKAQGVGPAGRIPERSVLEYPMNGLEIEAGGRRYVGMALANTIGPEDAYYVKVEAGDQGPQGVVFGPLPGEDQEAEAHVTRLVPDRESG